jgi:beta-lactam-binding protein with PASTA domain
VALGKVLSAFGKIGVVALVAIAFAFGLLLTVYLSLRSPNIPVPDVAGKSYFDGETELARAGLDIRERAKRYKPDVPPGVIIDQSPRPGDIIKAGQTVAVVVSRAPKEGEKPPDEAVAEERREERGTQAIVENKNGNQNRERRRNANRNANSNGANNSNAASNTNGGNTSNGGSRNTNSANSNAGRANSNANANRPRTTNSNSRNANSGGPRNTNANRRPNP